MKPVRSISIRSDTIVQEGYRLEISGKKCN